MLTRVCPFKFTKATLLLIASNLIPLAGVLWLDWDLFQVIFLYWAETAVIGIFSLIRIGVIGGKSSIFFIPFFLLHFGIFMFGHLVFIIAMFAPNKDSFSTFSVRTVASELLPIIYLPLLALFVSHGVSFFQNFRGKREYERSTATMQMLMPYKRIILMHVTIILGGFAVMISGASVLGLVILVCLKIAFDLRAHYLEHRSLALRPSQPQQTLAPKSSIIAG